MRFDLKPIKKVLMVGLVGAIVGSVGACGFSDPLRVQDPGTLTDDELTGVGAVPATVNGMIGQFQEALDDYVRYSCLFTDECILAGTFPTRVEVENRRITTANVSLDDEVYEPIHTARFQADNTVEQFQTIDQSDPEFAGVVGKIQEGIVAGFLYGGYTRVLLAELYCESAINAGSYVFSDERMRDALTILEQAETEANNVGLSSYANAAIVGQARAHLWLGEDGNAAADAARVPAGFVFNANYSENDDASFNEMHSSSWGRGGWVIRWTVGDGTRGDRNNERFGQQLVTQGVNVTDSFDEWVNIGLIDPDPGPNFVAFNSAIPVKLQLKYRAGTAPIRIASTTEADFIEAEAAIRGSDFATANTIVNGYRATWTDETTGNPLPAIDYAALPDLQSRLIQLAQDRNRDMWLEGERQGTFRRFFRRDGIDLYTPVTAAATFNQICFPVHQQELDTNSNPANCPDPSVPCTP